MGFQHNGEKGILTFIEQKFTFDEAWPFVENKYKKTVVDNKMSSTCLFKMGASFAYEGVATRSTVFVIKK